MDFEFGFKTLWPIATAAFWFWVNGISGRLKEADKRIDDLKEELHASSSLITPRRTPRQTALILQQRWNELKTS